MKKILNWLVCVLGMTVCVVMLWFDLSNAWHGWGFNWWYAFAFSALFYLFSRKYDKLVGRD